MQASLRVGEQIERKTESPAGIRTKKKDISPKIMIKASCGLLRFVLVVIINATDTSAQQHSALC